MPNLLRYEDIDRFVCLRDSMFRDRAAQFIGRHQWDLPLAPGGREVDEFDAPGTLYCVIEENMRHVASVRLRAARDGSMVERHFSPLWDRFAPELRDKWEVTRLLVAPRPSCKGMIDELLIALCEACLRRDIPSFFGVVFPSVARTLARAGWAPRVLGRLEHGGQDLLLCVWEATHLVHWELQTRHERRREKPEEAARSIAA